MRLRPAAPGMRRLPRFWLGLLMLVALAGWYASERQIREAHAYLGVPQAARLNVQTFHRVFRNEGFMLGYSDWRGQPLWVTYRLAPIGERKNLPRPGRFSADARAFSWIGHDDYTASGFDRGHLAPNYAISQLYGPEAQKQTFLMSNISPQRPNLNQKVWQRLEETAADAFAPAFGEVWVTTGPVFEPAARRIASGKVAVPSAFYALFAVPGPEPKLLAFLIPQTVRGDEPLERFIVSVDAIERQTGLDFLHRLEDALESKLEAQIEPGGWPVLAGTKNRF